jgi:hypothetical protein
MGYLSFFSWFIFIIFEGVGLPALPLDLIYDFVKRPKKIPKETRNGKTYIIKLF